MFVIGWEHELITNQLSEDMVYCDAMKEVCYDYLPAVLWGDKITVQCLNRMVPYWLKFLYDVVLWKELENITPNTATYTQGIENIVTPLAARAMELEWWRDNIHATMQDPKELSHAKNCYINPVANLRAGDLQIGNLALAHEIKMEQFHTTTLDGWWWGPYHTSDFAQTLGTYISKMYFCLWEPLGASGSLWEPLGASGRLWGCLEAVGPESHISKMDFSQWEPQGVTERMWSVN